MFPELSGFTAPARDFVKRELVPAVSEDFNDAVDGMLRWAGIRGRIAGNTLQFQACCVGRDILPSES